MKYFNPDPKPEKKVKPPYAGIKRKVTGNTDQVDLMKHVFTERGGICEITGDDLGEFHPFKVHHLISKKTYTRFKLEKFNLIVIDPDIHYAYHNNSREYVLSMWSKAIILYDKAEELRIEYNKPKQTV